MSVGAFTGSHSGGGCRVQAGQEGRSPKREAQSCQAWQMEPGVTAEEGVVFSTPQTHAGTGVSRAPHSIPHGLSAAKLGVGKSGSPLRGSRQLAQRLTGHTWSRGLGQRDLWRKAQRL